MSRRVPDLLLEKLALGELSDAQRAEVEALLAREPGGQARLEALRRDDARVLEQYPPRPMVAAITQRAEAERRRDSRKRLLLVGVPALAAAAAIVLLVIVPRAEHVVPPAAGGSSAGGALRSSDPRVRLKGDPMVLIYRKDDGERSTRLVSGARARAGDRLQIVYVAGWARHGVIFSVDGNGSVTHHLPARAGVSAPLSHGKPTRLDASFELDDAPGFERLFFVASKTPFDPQSIVAAARQIAAQGSLDSRRRERLAAPRGLFVKEVLLVKPGGGQR